MQRWAWLWLLPALIAFIGWHQASSIKLDVGEPRDGPYIQGFYAREGDSETSGRWTTTHARIQLPAPGSALALTIQGAIAPNVAHVWANVNHYTITLPASTDPTSQSKIQNLKSKILTSQSKIQNPNSKIYVLFVPSVDPWSANITLDLHSPGVPLSDTDTRTAGIFVRDVSLLALGKSLTPPPNVLLAVALICLLFWGILRLTTIRPTWAAVFAVSAGDILAAGWGWQRIWVDPYLWPVLVGLCWIVGVTLAFRPAARTTLAPPQLLALLLAMPVGLLIWLFVRSAHYGVPLGPPPPLGYIALASAPLGLLLAYIKGHQRRFVVALIVLLALVFAANTYLVVWTKASADDFNALYGGPHALRNGGQLYNVAAIHAEPFLAHFKYPPFFAVLMLPFTWLPIGAAFQLWKATQLALVLASAFLLWRIKIGRVQRWSTLWLLLVLLLFQPIADTMRYGQVDIMLLLCLVCSLWTIQRERWFLYGILIAFATVIKLYPAYLLLLPVLRGHWRAMWGWIAGLIVFTGISLLALGPETHLIYLRDVARYTGASTAWVENQTINGLLNRLIQRDPFMLAPTNNPLLTWTSYAIGGALTLLTLWRSRTLPNNFAYSLLIVAMLIVLPVAWIHYETLLVIPLVCIVVSLEKAGTITWDRALPLAVAWTLLCFGDHNAFYDGAPTSPWWQLTFSYKLWGLLLLYAVIGAPWRSRTSMATTSTSSPEPTTISL